jgi:hypothetical protein
MTTPETFDDLRGDLPGHQAEVMAAHQTTWPSVEVQSATHGKGAPPEDRGMSSQEKYGTGAA